MIKFLCCSMIAAFFLGSCRQEVINYPHCWHCKVPSGERAVDTCTKDDAAPLFRDDNGIPVEADCHKKP